MSKHLLGKVALVTGGSRGIGAAIAKALAADGAAVVIGYGSAADKAAAVVRELEAAGVKAAAVKADQADPAQVAKLVETTVERFGRLDILVNNAGVFAMGVLGDPTADLAALEREFAINVGGVVAAVRAAAKVMGAGGRIITIGSGLGARVPFSGLAGYAATKAAVVGYTKGVGTRPRAEGNYGQHRATRADRHRHEPGQRRLLCRPEVSHCPRPLRQAGRSRGGCRFLGQPRSGLHHRDDARCGRRV